MSPLCKRMHHTYQVKKLVSLQKFIRSECVRSTPDPEPFGSIGEVRQEGGEDEVVCTLLKSNTIGSLKLESIAALSSRASSRGRSALLSTITIAPHVSFIADNLWRSSRPEDVMVRKRNRHLTFCVTCNVP